MKATNKTLVPALLIAGAIALLALVLIFKPFNFARGDVQNTGVAQLGKWDSYTFFSTSTNQVVYATTTSATSTNIAQWTNSSGAIDNGYFVVAGARKVSLFFSRGDTAGNGNSGSTKFRIQVTNKVTPSESDWVDYNNLYQNAATGTTPTIVSSITVTAATSTVMTSVDPLSTFYAIRCIVQETTDGEHTCRATATY